MCFQWKSQSLRKHNHSLIISHLLSAFCLLRFVWIIEISLFVFIQTIHNDSILMKMSSEIEGSFYSVSLLFRKPIELCKISCHKTFCRTHLHRFFGFLTSFSPRNVIINVMYFAIWTQTVIRKTRKKTRRQQKTKKLAT